MYRKCKLISEPYFSKCLKQGVFSMRVYYHFNIHKKVFSRKYTSFSVRYVDEMYLPELKLILCLFVRCPPGWPPIPTPIETGNTFPVPKFRRRKEKCSSAHIWKWREKDGLKIELFFCLRRSPDHGNVEVVVVAVVFQNSRTFLVRAKTGFRFLSH